jgi:hypothetical protein
MKKVDRSELLDLGPYEQIRPHFRQRVIEQKRRRRVELPNLSLVFENHDTVLLQVQEMLRTERITDERSIAHELTTYNDLIPEPGQISATLFIEYDEAAERKIMLEKLASIRTGVHLVIGSQKVTARFVTQPGEELDRLPAVCFVIFEPGAAAAGALSDPATRVALEIDHPAGRIAHELPPALRAELAADLG